MTTVRDHYLLTADRGLWQKATKASTACLVYRPTGLPSDKMSGASVVCLTYCYIQLLPTAYYLARPRQLLLAWPE